MIKYTEDIYATCPFYQKDAANRLVCEGICDGSSTSTVFRNSLLKARYQNRYCRNDYNSCGLCKVLMSKYD